MSSCCQYSQKDWFYSEYSSVYTLFIYSSTCSFNVGAWIDANINATSLPSIQNAVDNTGITKKSEAVNKKPIDHELTVAATEKKEQIQSPSNQLLVNVNVLDENSEHKGSTIVPSHE